MFEIGRDDLGLKVIFDSLKEHVEDKNQLLQQYSTNLLSTLNKNLHPNESIIQISKQTRKCVQQIQKTLQQSYTYLMALKLDFLHELLCKIFKIMVLTFNQLSTRFVMAIRSQNTISENRREQIGKESKQKQWVVYKDQYYQQREQFDTMIKNLEEEDRKIQIKKHLLERGFSQYISISSITASDAVQQLETFSKWLQKLVTTTQKITEQTNNSRYHQLSSFLQSLKTPQEIKQQFFAQVSVNMKDKFIQIILKVLASLTQNLKKKQRQRIYQQLQNNKPILQNIGIQTQSENKIKIIENLNKDKKILSSQLQLYKKQICILEKQINILRDQINEQKCINVTLQKKIQETNENAKKKVIQLQKLKIQLDNKCQLTQKLKKKNQQLQNTISNNPTNRNSSNGLEEQQTNENKKNFMELDTIQQASRQKSNCIMTRRRTVMRDRISLNFQAENQLKQKKKQNLELKQNMEVLLSTLGKLNIIDQSHQTNLNNYIEQGTFLSKVIEQLKQTKKSQIVEIVQETQKQSKLEEKQKKKQTKIKKQPKKPTQQKPETISTKTKQQQIKIPKSKQQNNIINITSNHHTISNSNKDSQLQKLKSQFIEKLNNDRKIHESKFKKGHLLSQTNDCSNDGQNYQMNFSIDKAINDGKKSKDQCYNNLLSCKQIIFEQLKIKKKDKYIATKIKKLTNPPSSKNSIKYQQQRFPKPMLIIQGQQIGKYAKQVLSQFDNKKNKKDYFIKQFLKATLEQYKDNKSLNFIQEVVTNQINLLSSNHKKNELETNQITSKNNLLVIKTYR